MRCPDCNKFVSYDTELEPEIEREEVEPGGVVALEVRRALACQECGWELKEALLEMNIETEGEEECPDSDDSEHDWELEVSAHPTERSQTHGRRGKPIRNPRYWRTYYGVEVEGKLTCRHCKQEREFSGTEEEMASGFDELA